MATTINAPAHLAMPLQVLDGRMATLPQDDPAEIAQSVALLLATDVGERRSEPDYGISSQLFVTVFDQATVVDAIRELEPRADQPTIEVATTTLNGLPIPGSLDVHVSSGVLPSGDN